MSTTVNQEYPKVLKREVVEEAYKKEYFGLIRARAEALFHDRYPKVANPINDEEKNRLAELSKGNKSSAERDIIAQEVRVKILEELLDDLP